MAAVQGHIRLMNFKAQFHRVSEKDSRCHTASCRTSSPLRTTRSLNVAGLAAIPNGTGVPILASRHDKTPMFAIRSVDFSCFSIVAGEDSPNI
jgi:hypothetical protein